MVEQVDEPDQVLNLSFCEKLTKPLPGLRTSCQQLKVDTEYCTSTAAKAWIKHGLTTGSNFKYYFFESDRVI